ncbi:helix-turn-helix domain-containing protein [Pseudobacter ginsenosidimutans]|jgi:AraC-like DNA-binding protein|uniref:AraC-like DNA-binding protein n=1 Tax=Pseudobacter ginsenosidimutans TaxID=661488 RepID=A0A4Q7N2S1_9BACT|nr:AraC family transcriptional regulator [Pseudobacter ginsenosidimutans]QEC43814.1 helix-turn-helix transcriptional regulator [Pseudobacter ginsenosidimutans]RZS75234.1 AraC-like DNA-binding protein [Pseudobacter ginsenosidimutans]
MRKQADLKKFSVREYVQQQQSRFTGSFFIADQDTYKDNQEQFPFRTFAYSVGLFGACRTGRMQIGSAAFDIGSGCLSTIGPGIVCEWHIHCEGDHDTVFFNDDFFNDDARSAWLRTLPFFLPGGNHVIIPDDGKMEQLRSLFITLRQFREDKNVLTGILYSILMVVAACHDSAAAQSITSFSVHEKVTRHFRELLSVHFLQEKSVAFYAHQLQLSPKYLSEILQAVTGKSAKTMILDHTLMEARTLLRQTEMSIQEISSWLGYEDYSYFTKAFKKKEGITPMAYRKL